MKIIYAAFVTDSRRCSRDNNNKFLTFPDPDGGWMGFVDAVGTTDVTQDITSESSPDGPGGVPRGGASGDTGETQDGSGKKRRELSPSFLSGRNIGRCVVAMGVLDRAKKVSGVGDTAERQPYVCLACDTPLEVQHHACPVCGSFDVRRSKWVE